MEASRIPSAKLNRILQMEPQLADHRDLTLLSSCLQKYTDAYVNHKSKKPPMLPVILGLLTSPDYRLKDFQALMVNGYSRNPQLTVSLFRELMQMDLRPVLQKVSIPYYMLQGDTDVVAVTDFVQKLADDAENPNLHCEIVKDSGHFPSVPTMDRVLSLLTALRESRMP